MHSFIPTVFIYYACIAALFSSLISPALSAPIAIAARHGYHTDSQRGYPASSASSPWSRVYTYGKLADKFLMVNDAYMTDGSLWQNSLKVYNAVSAYRFPPQRHYSPQQEKQGHQPPQFQQPDATSYHHVDCEEELDRRSASRARLIAKFKKYAKIKNLALANMKRKVAFRLRADTNSLKSESPSVQGEGEGKACVACKFIPSIVTVPWAMKPSAFDSEKYVNKGNLPRHTTHDDNRMCMNIEVGQKSDSYSTGPHRNIYAAHWANYKGSTGEVIQFSIELKILMPNSFETIQHLDMNYCGDSILRQP
ncbi:hypothetical protein CVT25_001443 [Psilocybe cyanescens]|uniref:Uncharacterized protein n=1 Tax=Psilocybe cyanescens TaxID=93625 RepID=A0A409WNR8_PSICY|nr:hypothetical protein CVT25_001443 [Psilocybe cyanescens]